MTSPDISIALTDCGHKNTYHVQTDCTLLPEKTKSIPYLSSWVGRELLHKSNPKITTQLSGGQVRLPPLPFQQLFILAAWSTSQPALGSSPSACPAPLPPPRSHRQGLGWLTRESPSSRSDVKGEWRHHPRGPAQVQATFLGHPGVSGLANLDLLPLKRRTLHLKALSPLLGVALGVDNNCH